MKICVKYVRDGIQELFSFFYEVMHGRDMQI
jgi:hypothetical protein